MHGIKEYHHQEAVRVRKVLEDTRELDSGKRLEVLRNELEGSITARKLMLTEGFSSLMGNFSASSDLVREDPRFDDGEVWDNVGSRRGRGHGRGRILTKRHLDHAREIGRWFAAENEYVIGSMENRVAYTVGEGLIWRVVPRSRDTEDKTLIHAATEILEEFREEEEMDIVEQEWIRRQDRDGEALLRIFANADGPPRARFLDPADLDAPSMIAEGLSDRAQHAMSLGVETLPEDVRTVLAYHLRESLGTELSRVVVDTGMGIRHVHHAKLNVDLNDPRGWPTYWPIRGNMERAEKLLRNMSYVAALQSAIALIRKHDTGTKNELEAFAAQHAALVQQSPVTGQPRAHTSMQPGTVIDGGPGVNYESPVSSVNSSNNLPVLGADLQAAAACVNQPEFMFSGKVGSGGYAGQMIAEGPPHKNFKRLQSRNKRPLTRIHWDVLTHAVFWGRLDPRVLTHCRLEADFPETQVRDLLQTTQRHQILHTSGVISRHTWGAKEGFSPDVEQRHLDAEAKAGYDDPRKSSGPDLSKPPAGSTDGGPGGGDFRGNPDSPETTAVQTF